MGQAFLPNTLGGKTLTRPGSTSRGHVKRSSSIRDALRQDIESLHETRRYRAEHITPAIHPVFDLDTPVSITASSGVSLAQEHVEPFNSSVKFRFTGRVKGKTLKPGSYRMRAVARNVSGASKAVTKRFKVKKG